MQKNGIVQMDLLQDGTALFPSGYVKYLYPDKASVSQTSSVHNDTINMYAKWTDRTFTIKYDGNGNTGGTMADIKVYYGIVTPLRTNAFTRTGKTFAGWHASRVKNGVTENFYQNTSGTTVGATSQPTGYTLYVYANNQTLSRDCAARTEKQPANPRIRAALKGESWKFKRIGAIDLALEAAKSRAEFIKRMRQMGYGVAWSDTRKFITYTTPEGQKYRDNKLHDEKHLKENMEAHFGQRQVEGPEPARKSVAQLPDGGAAVRDPAGNPSSQA